MARPKLGDTLPISEKIENFFTRDRQDFRPRIGLVYHPKKIRKTIRYSKPNFHTFYGYGQGGHDVWIKHKRVGIRVRAEYEGRYIQCNFEVVDEYNCKIYVRKPHSKKVEFTLTLPTKELTFWKHNYREKGINYVDYQVDISKIAENESDEEKILGKLLSIKTEHHTKKIVRRRGTAIVDTANGIIVASGRKRLFLLPGGGANKGESREKATIRELKEETGMKAISCKYLFEYNEPDDGRKIQNLHKVFLIKAIGEPKPNHHDVKHIAYWKPESDIKVSRTTKLIIDRYIKEFKNKKNI
jgi:8-oxo-dGTP diphosphatase